MTIGVGSEPGIAARRRARVTSADQRFEALLDDALTAAGTAATGVSVVAVGGYGRAELSPASDLDVLLVYDQRFGAVESVAERLWYPIWDAGIALDHSVRTVEETREAADRDLRTALSVLDARHIAGDSSLTLRLRATLLADWRRHAPRRLRDLETSARERAEAAGELASLLEPDLKNAHGGLRDGVVLRAVAATWLVDVPHAKLAHARADLLDIRDALHDVAGRRQGDRLLAELQGEVANRLGLAGRHALLRRVYAAARTVGHLGDLVWRRVAHALSARSGRRTSRQRPGPVLTELASGVAAADGEVVLAANTKPAHDPELVLRVAAAAATRSLPLSPYACAQLRREAGPLPTPWSDEARRHLSALLGAGPSLVPTWEALDQAGLVEPLLPDWKVVRDHPQDSPVHRFTLDRHLLQTCVQASALVRRVTRPDLLLLAALLHDLGKAMPGDHSVVGADLAAGVLDRWGWSPPEKATVVRLVRHHLLLVDTATRRDLDDPATTDLLAGIVGDVDTLELLAALSEADARATGPAAWTSWRAGLVTQLVDRVRSRLERRPPAEPAAPERWQLDLIRRGTKHGRLEIAVDEAWGSKRVTVISRGQSGVLAATAGVLAMSGVSIRSASVRTVQEDGHDIGLAVWTVDGEPAQSSVLRDQIRAVLAGRIDLVAQLSTRDAAYARPRDRISELGELKSEPAPEVSVAGDASHTATVLEVRAADRPGLFYKICAALVEAECEVRSAHVSTWGRDVVDVFYLTDSSGRSLNPGAAATVVEAVRHGVIDQA